MNIKSKTTSDLLKHLHKTASGGLEHATGAEPALYWNEDIAKMEEDKIFRQDWLCAGLAAEIPNKGDYLTHTIAGEPVFVMRDASGAINTYSNVCRHRMMQLLEGSGNVARVTCPYHAWTYDLKGQLVGAGHMEHSVGFDKKDICLPKIRTEIWNGWIYISLNPDAVSPADALAPLDALVARYGMESYVPVVQEEHVWDTNWKLLTENFMEGYHLPVAHKATVGAWLAIEQTKFPQTKFDSFTYQIFEKSGKATYGQAHPDNTKLKDDWRNRSIMPTVFPCHMYVLAPDHLWYLSLHPKGVGQVSIRFGAAIAPEVDAALTDPKERQAWTDQLISFFGHVNEEDRQVVEGIYAGAKSSFAAPGPLSWLEHEIHDFQSYLSNRLGSGDIS